MKSLLPVLFLLFVVISSPAAESPELKCAKILDQPIRE
jgi:hypothetical protein